MKGLSVRSLLLEEEKQMLEVWVAGRKTFSFGIIDCFCFCVSGSKKRAKVFTGVFLGAWQAWTALAEPHLLVFAVYCGEKRWSIDLLL
jgi:hypothetical protein